MIKNEKIVIILVLNQSFTNISSLPKNTPQICLILHQFDFYVLFNRWKKFSDD